MKLKEVGQDKIRLHIYRENNRYATYAFYATVEVGDETYVMNWDDVELTKVQSGDEVTNKVSMANAGLEAFVDDLQNSGIFPTFERQYKEQTERFIMLMEHKNDLRKLALK